MLFSLCNKSNLTHLCKIERGSKCNGGCNNGNGKFTQKDVEEDVKSQFNKYSGYSENQLIDEFYKEVYKQKQLGNLSPAMLQNLTLKCS